ncbi:MAG: PDDEXK nuclease domain-containing protein [Oscillospiraceae bacterium]|nr:PDDEXK nuclease domain-containing protein [Oscillospiraceae bacterium]
MENYIANKDESVILEEYKSTDNIVADVKAIIETAQNSAYEAINAVIIRKNWLIGRRIVEEEQQGKDRAVYGTHLISELSKSLTSDLGSGYSPRNLRNYRDFYQTYSEDEIWHTRVPNLTWSHYRALLRVDDKKARDWYMSETVREAWSVKTLERNISTQYYYRLLKSQVKEPVIEEMKDKTKAYQLDKLEFIKNPIIAEFLGLSQNTSFTETELESAILNHLQKFLMELGKGYAFVARQQHIRTELSDYYIDLVFYNYILKCFVLIDLKSGPITHQDVGQMDMYIRMYDEMKRSEGDNPTLGIVLCSDTDEDVAKYSLLNGSEQLFASKYKLYLPSEDELRQEIEVQKSIFLQQKESETGFCCPG